MKRIWEEKAWDEYEYWLSQDLKTVKKINKLIKDIERNGHNGIGKPEALSGNLSGLWSRHIDDKNRLVYRIVGDKIEIAQCRGHYDDK